MHKLITKIAVSTVLSLSVVSIAGAATAYRPAIAAHRGASGYLPEHTLEAKAMAYALNPDYIEQDVVLTKDGVAVISHDHTLETTTDVAQKFPDRHRADGSYYAIDFTLAEIKSLIVTERFNPKTGEAIFKGRFPLDTQIDFRMPTLEEEFKFIQGLNKSTKKNIGVYVEIKEPAFHEKEGQDLTKITVDLLTKYGYNHPSSKAILQIFDYDAVVAARKMGWKGDLAMLVSSEGQHLIDDKARHAWLLTPEGIQNVSEYANIYAPSFLHLVEPKGKGHVVSELVALARKNGMKVHSWTHRIDSLPKGFESSDEMLDMAFKKMKLDGLFSDFPDVVDQYLKKNKMR